MSTIGATAWVFDENRRIYAKGEDGRSLGDGPIWREHWRPEKITSETSRSWVTEYKTKIPKRNRDPRWFALTQLEIDEQAYVHENRYRIIEAVSRVSDASTLRAIEAVLEREPKP